LRKQLARIELFDITVGQIEHHLREQDLQLWVWKNGQFFLITEIVHHPNVSVVVLKWAAGRLSPDTIRTGREIVSKWAKTYGCSQVEVAGRPGWSRLLGMKPLVTIYRGEL
jgi:hypothetical protein